MTPNNPLWALAQRLAEWLHREHLFEHDKRMAIYMGDTLWRDDGALPSGDRFTLWLACEL